ncbi:hypothetical protein [Micromonospora sp. WMMD812]|uniref:hypothetical protein n=1 Tax=Micromonospora sp. WMMD812 TaxID=3015152 RepID=UPI00248D11CE|nr:hypothetical protein [Micromonospora sp. WMMD812]WBB69093.1 hypothetical protein O7603_07015 [Micromonospora sp. WMMD812]
MSSYTITIAADDPSHATTTLKVEVNDTTPRITELVVRAGQGDGLTVGQIPAVDLDLLLRAIAPAASGQQAIATPPIAVSDEVPAAGGVSVENGEPAAGPAAVQATAPTAAADEPATSSPEGAGAVDVVVPKQASPATKASEAKKASRVPGAGVTRSRAGKQKTAAGAKATNTAGKATKRTAKATSSAGKGRVYRRSPADLEAVYQQAGSVAAVADHYDVPRHTAQGWIRTMRRRQAGPGSE